MIRRDNLKDDRERAESFQALSRPVSDSVEVTQPTLPNGGNSDAEPGDGVRPAEDAIDPLGRDESGESEIGRSLDDVDQGARNAPPMRNAIPEETDQLPLESEDGDLFMQSEDDIDY